MNDPKKAAWDDNYDPFAGGLNLFFLPMARAVLSISAIAHDSVELVSRVLSLGLSIASGRIDAAGYKQLVSDFEYLTNNSANIAAKNPVESKIRVKRIVTIVATGNGWTINPKAFY